MADCKNCIHIEVCKSADSCDGRVPGCRHFEPNTKHGRWIMKQEPITWCEDDVDIFWECSVCKCRNFGESPYCPCCGAIMDLPSITEQTTKALEAMDRKAHGGE